MSAVIQWSVFRDPHLDVVWRVMWMRQLQKPMFESKCAAMVYIEGLKQGRKPDPIEYND